MLVSKSTQNTSLLKDLVYQVAIEEFNKKEESWIQYLQDYRDFIRSHSKIMLVNGEILRKYVYRPRKFLSEHGSSDDMELAFMIANRLRFVTDFNLELTKVYIPDRNYISQLRKMYLTLQNQIKRL